MNRFLASLISLGLCALPALAQSPAEPSASSVVLKTDDEVAARETALILAGAFANEGFKMRDGHWCDSLIEGGKKTIQVNLYAGNQYWFSMGATPAAQELKVTVFDESGAQVNTESYAEGVTAAAGIISAASGPYFVQVEEVKGTPSTFCLVYSYK